MFELLILITIGVGIAFVFLAGATIGTNSQDSLGSLFVIGTRLPDRPHGTQEEDLPRFVFRDRAQVGAS